MSSASTTTAELSASRAAPVGVAIVGDDPALVDWARSVSACGGRIVAVAVAQPLVGPLQAIAPAAQFLADGRALTLREEVRAAIVGGVETLTASAAFELARTKTLLILPRPEQYGTEIGLLDLQQHAGSPAVPAFLHRWEPAITEYLRRFERGELGDLRLVRMERTVAPSGTGSPRVAHPVAAEMFLGDVDLLRLLGGEFDRVTALRIGTMGDGSTQTTVTLSSDGPPEAIWSLTAAAVPGWRVTLSGSRGEAVLSQSGETDVVLTIGGAETAVERGPSPRQRCLQDVLTLATGDLVAGEAQNAGEAALAASWRPVWRDCARAFALGSAVEESLRRRRTVTPRFAGNSERDQFKTQMTALGCGVLTWTLLGVIIGLVLGQTLDPRDSVERRAAAAETIVWHEDFEPVSSTLTSQAHRRLTERFAQEGSEAIVLVEPYGKLNDARVEAVRTVWKLLDRGGRPPQIEVRPIAGRAFHRLMLGIWVIVFAPLALFLAAQGLILLTRPGAAE